MEGRVDRDGAAEETFALGRLVNCIAEKFGGEFNLAVWRSPTAPPKLISAKLTSAISARKNYTLKFCFAIANRQI